MALDFRDQSTSGHSRRVADLTSGAAAAFGMDGSHLLQIEHGALLHDVGKLKIPDSILWKPARLDEDEWTTMRKHPGYGFEFLCGIEFLKDAAELVHAHHEKFDGSGYPRGISGKDIPFGARVFAIIDAVDAMIYKRPYNTPVNISGRLRRKSALRRNPFRSRPGRRNTCLPGKTSPSESSLTILNTISLVPVQVGHEKRTWLQTSDIQDVYCAGICAGNRSALADHFDIHLRLRKHDDAGRAEGRRPETGFAATRHSLQACGSSQEICPSLDAMLIESIEEWKDQVAWIRILDDARHGNRCGGRCSQKLSDQCAFELWNPEVRQDDFAGNALVATYPFNVGHSRGMRLEIAVYLNSVSASFASLRQNLITGVSAALALMGALIILALRFPKYLRGQQVQGQVDLARRVQADLLPARDSEIAKL